MHDESQVIKVRRPSALDAIFGEAAQPTAQAAAKSPAEAGGPEEASCPAFTYLRGLRERALAVEFCFKTGDREWFAYNLLGSWRYNPSIGLLLKFTGDLVTLVLIRGSNLDALVNDTVNLTDRGFQRHRILSVREMDEDELRNAGKGQPTIDRFEVGEFETAEEQREWLGKAAAAFLRK
jgi:hypothetical protein